MKDKKNIFLNIRIFATSLLMFGFANAYSQEDFGVDENELGRNGPEDGYRIFVLSAGVFEALPIGDNFVNDALKMKIGLQNTFMVNLFSTHALVGINMKINNAEVTNRNLVGNYRRTNLTMFSFVAGYWVRLGKNFRFLPKLGVGPVIYKSHGDGGGFDFSDNGTSFIVTPTISYKFTEHLGIYLSGTYRRDFLKTETAAPIQDYFDNADYLSFGLGIQFSWE